jgi:acyl-CoA thioester hydrolase
MVVNETQIRVRYGETDRMGYAYYGNYLLYYEVGRTEMIRQLGLTYRQLEDNGTFLPVHSVQIKYIAPATYDDLLTVKTSLKEYPGVSIKFEYEIINSSGKIINTGEVKLVFVDSQTHRPVKAPKYFLDLLDPYFNNK